MESLYEAAVPLTKTNSKQGLELTDVQQLLTAASATPLQMCTQP